MRREWLAVALMISISTGPSIGAGKEGAYFCVEEFGGGIRYDEVRKQWVGSGFRAREKFVLQLKFVGSGETVYGTWEEYNATIRKSGSNLLEYCYGKETNKIAKIDEVGYMSCSAGLHGYVFHMTYNRYMSIYSVGFINGEDTKADTSSIMAGTCTKIQ